MRPLWWMWSRLPWFHQWGGQTPSCLMTCQALQHHLH